MITERLNSPSWVERIVQLRPLKTHRIMEKKRHCRRVKSRIFLSGGHLGNLWLELNGNRIQSYETHLFIAVFM